MSALDTVPLDRVTLSRDDHALLAPCLECCVFLDVTSPEVVTDFVTRAADLLGDALTHARIDSAKRLSRRTRPVPDLIAPWVERPRPGRNYFAEFLGAGEGTSAASLTVILYPRPRVTLTPDQVAARKANLRRTYEELNATMMPPLSLLRVTLPLDHPVAAEPERFVQWILGLQCVRDWPFATGTASLALNFDDTVATSAERSAMQSKLAAAVLRHPGLSWTQPGAYIGRLFRYESSMQDLVPLVPRAAWLTLVSDRSADAIGGTAGLHRAFADAPEVTLYDVAHGVVVRAGAAPDAGDVSRGDYLPALRRVATVVRPIRLATHIGLGRELDEDLAQEWLDAFDRTYE